MAQFTMQINVWKKEVFGDIFRKKKRLLARISGIQSAPNYGRSRYLDKIEKELQSQLRDTLDHEERLWLQKSKAQWLQDGDKNTCYYHTKTIIKRRRNTILTLTDESGNWVYDHEKLQQMGCSFFSDLYIEENRDCPTLSCNTSYPALEAQLKALFPQPINPQEVRSTMFNIRPLKAQGPMGIPVCFTNKIGISLGTLLLA